MDIMNAIRNATPGQAIVGGVVLVGTGVVLENRVHVVDRTTAGIRKLVTAVTPVQTARTADAAAMDRAATAIEQLAAKASGKAQGAK